MQSLHGWMDVISSRVAMRGFVQDANRSAGVEVVAVEPVAPTHWLSGRDAVQLDRLVNHIDIRPVAVRAIEPVDEVSRGSDLTDPLVKGCLVVTRDEVLAGRGMSAAPASARSLFLRGR